MPDKIIGGTVWKIENPEYLINSANLIPPTEYEKDIIDNNWSIEEQKEINRIIDFIYDLIVNEGKIVTGNYNIDLFAKDDIKIAKISNENDGTRRLTITTSLYENFNIKEHSFIYTNLFSDHKINQLIEWTKYDTDEKSLKDFIQDKQKNDYSSFITIK